MVTREQQTVDEKYMTEALRLARKGRGYVRSNPMVGAVIVKKNRIVGKGYHQRFGEAHAEINALAEAGDEASGATLYVNLEPCCFHGKTPPCVEAISDAGIARVVAGMQDPNSRVDGAGFQILAKKGIEVVTGVRERECRKLNEAYNKFITRALPFITVKIAQSLDGRIATNTGHSKWITCPEARSFGYQLRSEHDAILVGAGTVRSDDPLLTLHEKKGAVPRRIVLDNTLSIHLDAQLLTDEYVTKTIVATTGKASMKKVKRIEERGVTVLLFESDETGMIPIVDLWRRLAELEIASLLVEGGSQVFTSVLKEGNVDRLVIFLAPKLLGCGLNSIGDLGIDNVNAALELQEVSLKKVGSDYMFDGRLRYSS